jgi:hypothetical protein
MAMRVQSVFGLTSCLRLVYGKFRTIANVVYAASLAGNSRFYQLKFSILFVKGRSTEGVGMVYRPRTKLKLARKAKRCPKCNKLVRMRVRCKTCHKKLR